MRQPRSRGRPMDRCAISSIAVVGDTDPSQAPRPGRHPGHRSAGHEPPLAERPCGWRRRPRLSWPTLAGFADVAKRCHAGTTATRRDGSIGEDQRRGEDGGFRQLVIGTEPGWSKKKSRDDCFSDFRDEMAKMRHSVNVSVHLDIVLLGCTIADKIGHTA
jgi:hypothetical protein